MKILTTSVYENGKCLGHISTDVSQEEYFQVHKESIEKLKESLKYEKEKR